MGINRWEEQQERADKTGRDPDKLPSNEGKGDESSRMRASEEPAEDREKQKVVKKLQEREGGDE